MRVTDKIELDARAERKLRILAKRGRVEARVRQRASLILLAAHLGLSATARNRACP